MSFRTRIVIAALVVAWIPVLALGLLMRSVGAERLAGANDLRMLQRADAVAAAWQEDVLRLEARLESLALLLAEDNAVRVALRSGRAQALDEALARFASAGGVRVACVLDASGTILAASHFPGDAGRRDPGLARLAEMPDAPVVGVVSLPRGDVAAVLRARRIDVGGVGVVAVVGTALADLAAVPAGGDVWLLARAEGEGGGVERAVPGPEGTLPARAEIEGRRRIGGVAWLGWDDDTDYANVDLHIAWRDPVLAAMVRSWDRALLLSLAGSALLALLLGGVLAPRLSGPVERLADTARRVHLGRLDATFGRGGGRELDRLSYFLDGMLKRIRDEVARVRDAEKRATVGELARQVNHDVRNGLVPIRNVLDHLGQAHRSGPGDLAEAFEARSRTLVESLDYLGDLADQYRAVAVHGRRDRAELAEVARAVVASYTEVPEGVRIVESLGMEEAWVEMDTVSLRRVVENLVTNAVAAVEGEGGEVVVSLEEAGREGAPAYRLTVADDGPGIPAELRARVFEPFFTSRREGTGLGLAIARRLVTDVGGRIVLESEQGRGTCLHVILGVAEPPESAQQETVREEA
ncbi:MAG: HAMP domain-containing sensor histidine kinase [Gemmatimonadota bacterium]|nr:HAMP domain-containing sensor histidine kinase [Gemmatimonadota bacterium]MDE2986321.1 HAMP domain-containing sensor histidine kinase [Gemmatimonadota bacterium]